VIATQNPLSQVGTFPLPESQLDRFLMCISLGYPDRAAERALLAGEARRDMLKSLPAPRASDLVAAQAEVKRVYVAAALLDYIQALMGHARLRKVRRRPIAARRTGAARGRARLGMARRTQSCHPRGRAERNAGRCGHRLHAMSRDSNRACTARNLSPADQRRSGAIEASRARARMR
jgi:MoxR-like ATPase